MSDLVVFAFDKERRALEARDALIRMQEEQLIEHEDAALVIRPLEGKPKVKQVTGLTGAGALGGASGEC